MKLPENRKVQADGFTCNSTKTFKGKTYTFSDTMTYNDIQSLPENKSRRHFLAHSMKQAFSYTHKSDKDIPRMKTKGLLSFMNIKAKSSINCYQIKCSNV